MDTLPYVEPHEVGSAQKLIDAQFTTMTGAPFGFRPAGYMLVAKIWVRPEESKIIKRDDGTEATLWNSDISRDQDKLSSVSALVCALGPDCYKGENRDGTPRFPYGPWCRVGDWIVLARYSSFLFQYKGVAMAMLNDDKVLGIVQDPTDVSPIYVAPRI